MSPIFCLYFLKLSHIFCFSFLNIFFIGSLQILLFLSCHFFIISSHHHLHCQKKALVFKMVIWDWASSCEILKNLNSIVITKQCPPVFCCQVFLFKVVFVFHTIQGLGWTCSCHHRRSGYLSSVTNILQLPKLLATRENKHLTTSVQVERTQSPQKSSNAVYQWPVTFR